MDPLQYQEILYSHQGTKLQVSVNSSGKVVMVPVMYPGDSPSPTDSLSQHVTTHIITPEQFQQATAAEQPSSYHSTGSGAVRGGSTSMYDGLELGGADENLADLQPEDSDDEEEDLRPELSAEQQKLEFMAAVNLVPPAVLEEIQRRQKLCRAEYGNWWDRQHSTDFCLVPKSSSVLNKPQVVEEEAVEIYEEPREYPLMTVGEDQTQVAAGPDAESMVEQITYLTSWPAPDEVIPPPEATPSGPAPTNTVEVVTTPTTGHPHVHQMVGVAPAAHHHTQHGGMGVAGHAQSHGLVGGAGNPVVVDEDQPYHITFQTIDNYSAR